MISVIVCSNNDERMKAVEKMYARTLHGVAFEFIGIRSPKSLTSGFNQGAKASTGQTLLFSHDDVEVISPNLPGIIEEALTECDLAGVAGTTKLVTPKWLGAGPPYVFGQILHPAQPAGMLALNIFNAPRRIIHNIQALDGVFIAARRDVWTQIPFDEATFDGFHIYDIDFTFRAHLAGRKLCVRNDIQLYHASAGDFADPKWGLYADRFMKKHGDKMPSYWVRQHQWAGTYVRNWDEARTLMTPEFWNEQ